MPGTQKRSENRPNRRVSRHHDIADYTSAVPAGVVDSEKARVRTKGERSRGRGEE